MNRKTIKTKRSIIPLAMLSLILLCPGIAPAAGPGTISYQGTLVDSQNTPPPNSGYPMHFALYDAMAGGELLWEETTSTVAVTNGAFAVALGNITPFPDGLFQDNASLWLEIQVDLNRDGFDAEETYSPRVPFNAAPYAFQSDNADSLGGKPAGGYLTTHGGVLDGPVTILTTTTKALVAESETVAVLGQAASAEGVGVQGFSLLGTASHIGIFPFAKSGGEFVGPNGLVAVTTGEALSGAGVIGATHNESGVGVFGYSTGSNAKGVHGIAATTTGTAVAVHGEAQAPNSVGGLFTNNALGGFALRAEATGLAGVAIRAQGTGVIQSTADSYVWAPATSGFSLLDVTEMVVQRWFYGRVRLWALSGVNVKQYQFPVTMPSVLYGQNVTIEEVTLFYSTSDPATYITGIDVHVLTGARSYVTLMSDTTDHTSLIPTHYSILPAQPVNLSSAYGPITVQVHIYFADASSVVSLGAVRIRLGHS